MIIWLDYLFVCWAYGINSPMYIRESVCVLSFVEIMVGIIALVICFATKERQK